MGEAGDNVTLDQDERLNVVVLDTATPEITALDLSRYITLQAPSVEVITLTTVGDKDREQWLLDADP